VSEPIDFLVPPVVRQDPRARARYQAVARLLLTVSGVGLAVTLLYLGLRRAPGGLEVAAPLGCVAVPLLGALAIRLTGRLRLCLALTNIAGIVLLSLFAFVTGGIESFALPWLLANFALLAGYGNRAALVLIGGLTLAALAALFGLGEAGLLPAHGLSRGEFVVAHLLSFLGATMVLGGGGLAILRTRRSSIEKLRQARHEAEAAAAGLALSEGRFRGFAEIASDWFWETDAELRLCHSAASEGADGRVPQATLGQQLWQLDWTSPGDEAWRHQRTLMAEGRPFRGFECSVTNSDGVEIFWTLGGQPMLESDGGFQGYRGVGRDITERRQAERRKDEFVSTVSHELRTPLTSMLGALGLLKGGVGGHIPENSMALLDLAIDNAERLRELITDILDIKAIEAGHMPYEMRRTRLEPLLREAATKCRRLSEQRQVEFCLEGLDSGLEVYGDGERLGKALGHILANAAKFSPAGQSVEVTLRRNGDRAEIAITDHGPGIAADFRHRVFDKFSQGDASDQRHFGGTGLGLSITRAVAERHDGRVDFESEPGSTTFTVSLPLHTGYAPE
jgi:PAS domain S-box-containing protein